MTATSPSPAEPAPIPVVVAGALGRMGAEVISALEARGHRLKIVPDLEGPCSVEAIRVLDNGVRMAASDPRRDGWAGAW